MGLAGKMMDLAGVMVKKAGKSSKYAGNVSELAGKRVTYLKKDDPLEYRGSILFICYLVLVHLVKGSVKFDFKEFIVKDGVSF
jgi:hypothetical protein